GPRTGEQELDLGAGMRELLTEGDATGNGRGTRARACLTWGLEFNKRAGWDRSKAEAWVQNHVGLRDLGRTACLEVPYRMRPELASFLSDLLFAGHYRAGDSRVSDFVAGKNGVDVPVEFVAVPPLRPLQRDSGRHVS